MDESKDWNLFKEFFPLKKSKFLVMCGSLWQSKIVHFSLTIVFHEYMALKSRSRLQSQFHLKIPSNKSLNQRSMLLNLIKAHLSAVLTFDFSRTICYFAPLTKFSFKINWDSFISIMWQFIKLSVFIKLYELLDHLNKSYY